MIQSMTGYGWGELTHDRGSLSLEIKGYNNRYLDIQISLPGTLGQLENELKKRIKEVCVRGRVELYLRVQSVNEEPEINIDSRQAEGLAQALKTLASDLKLAGKPSLDNLLAFEGIIKIEKKRNPEEIKPLVQEVFEKALEDFTQSRKTEGKTTLADILGQLNRFESSFGEIVGRESEIEEHISSQLRTRFDDVMGDRVDEDRIITELASLLVKHSINEEISRLQAHIDQFHSELDNGGPLGKRLDFLCQEMNRETNTIGSKNLLKEISTQVIEMKDSLENIREQLRNIE